MNQFIKIRLDAEIAYLDQAITLYSGRTGDEVYNECAKQVRRAYEESQDFLIGIRDMLEQLDKPLEDTPCTSEKDNFAKRLTQTLL